MEELWKLESVELTESRQFISKLHHRLKTTRDPVLLGELVDFYFTNGSRRARKLLTSLREAHSQDYFDKLQESIQKTSARLPVLKLLAHTLNSETSWLYRIVDHPLFTSMLEQLKTSNDIVVLCSALFVVTAILPLVPSYIGSHLHNLFGIFCSLATIRDTKRLGLTPKELCLHVDVAVYYFFLQLYALFPNNLFQYLRDHYGHSAIGEVDKFNESIVPLFYQVQLHPGLITGGGSYELSKSKWGAMEPDDIATLCLQHCLDSNVAIQEDPSCNTNGPSQAPVSRDQIRNNQSLSTLPSANLDNIAETPTTQLVLPVRPHNTLTSAPSIYDNGPGLNQTTAIPKVQVRNLDLLSSAPYNTTVLSDFPDPSGLKSFEELGQFWSPSTTLGYITPQQSSNISPNESSRSSVNFLTHPSLLPSNISSPLSDSAASSTLPTPRGTASNSTQLFTFKNYSPTASIESESLHARQQQQMTQSAIHTPLEDSHNSSQFDPLSQSMRTESSFLSGPNSAHGQGSPVRSLRVRRPGPRNSHNQSFKEKFGRFIGIFVTRTADADSSTGSEDFTEIHTSDVDRSQGHANSRPSSSLRGGPSTERYPVINSHPNSSLGGVQRSESVKVPCQEEIGEECLPGSVKDTQANTAEHDDTDSPDTCEDGSTTEQSACGLSQEQHDDTSKSVSESVDIPSLPLSSRPSRSNSESSQAEQTELDERRGPLQPFALDLDPRFSDVRKFSHNFGKASDIPQPYSFSFPERAPTEGMHKRARNSNSEASTTQTVLMVQERLKELVESTESSSSQYSVPCSTEENILSNSTPIDTVRASDNAGMYARGNGTSVCRQQLDRGISSDSTGTVLYNPLTQSGTKTPPSGGKFSNGPLTLSLNLNTSPTKATQPSSISSSLPNPNAPSTSVSNNANTLGVGLASRLFVRRVSVCSRKTGNHFSESSAESTKADTIPSIPTTHPSPVGLLDHYVSQGVMLHKGHFETIPLTELEGVDWNHFGGCPHSEEFGMMQAQVVLLHSQLLFERYQCLQHARRNRTLLSQARSATKVAEELLTLQDQLSKQNMVVRSLQEQLQKNISRHTSSLRSQETLQARNRALTAENKNLKDSNLKLLEEVQMLRGQNSGLERTLNHSNDKIFSLENDNTELKSRLRHAEKLKNEVETLSRELQVLGDLYQQQKEESLVFLGHKRPEQETKAMHTVLAREKDSAEKKVVVLRQGLGVAEAKVKELECAVERREKEIESLRRRLQTIQGKCQGRMLAIEDKYQSMKVIGLQLENHILEIKGKSLHVKKKRHKRSSSHPAGGHNPSSISHPPSPLTHPHNTDTPPTLLTH